MRSPRLASGAAVSLALTFTLFAPASLAASAPSPGTNAGTAAGGPALDVAPSILAASVSCAGPPLGSSDHDPVLLVHGTGLTPSQSWSWNYEDVLPKMGYSTCAVALPDAALGDIQVASEYVVYAIWTIARRSGQHLDVIGHSQGGIEPRWALEWWAGLRSLVDHYVGLASPNHGIYAANACADSGKCWPAVWQMAQTSKFMGALNRGDQAPGPATYTDVYSDTDELVQPAQPVPTAALPASPNVANVAVQQVCPGRYVNHGGMLVDAVVFALVMATIAHPGPLVTQRVPTSVCTEEFMPGVAPTQAITGNASIYTDAAQAFSRTPGTTSEPPLAPYAQ